MSTILNIIVSGFGLLNTDQLQREAARKAKLQKDADKKLEEKALGSALGTGSGGIEKEKDGQTKKPAQIGLLSPGPKIKKRPAANRKSSLAIGQSWLFYGDESVEGGIAGTVENPLIRYTGYWLDSYGPNTGGGVPTYGVGPSLNIRNPQHKYYVGCGNGSQWLDFSFGPTDMPEFPTPDYQVVDSFARTMVFPDSSTGSGTVTISTGYSMQNFENPVFSDYLILPVSKDLHILLFCARYYWGYDSEFGYYWHSTITSGYDNRDWVGILPWRLSGTDNVPSLIGSVESNGAEILESYFDRFPPEYRFEFWNASDALSSQVAGWAPGFGAPSDVPYYSDGTIETRGVISTSSYYGYGKINKAYLISQNNIKEISVPEKMKDWIEEFTEEAQVEVETINAPGSPEYDESYLFRYSDYIMGGAIFPVTRYKKIPVNFAPFRSATNGFKGKGNSVTATPDIYLQMNEAVEFTSPALVKSFPVNEAWLLEDLDKPGILGDYFRDNECLPSEGPEFESVYKSLYVPDAQFNYARWSALGETPDYAYFDEDCWEGSQNPYPPISPISKSNSLDPDPEPRAGLPDEENNDYLASSLNASYDGRDPAYCRQMLLELGFSESDLSFN